ncbi:TPA: XRE family transcriptional regulator [Proteus mirabilis]
MEIGKKIRSIRLKRNMTIAELANAIDSDPGNVSRLETGKQKSFTEQQLKKIANVLSISLLDLFSDEDNHTVYKHSNLNHDEMNEDLYKVQLLDISASAGPGCVRTSDVIDVIHSIEYDTEQAKLLFGSRPANSVKVINVRGDSMSGTIEPGDIIFVDISIDYIDGDGIYVFSFDGNIHVKRLQIVPDEIIVLSDNPKYTQWKINSTNEHRFCVHGKVLISQSLEYRRHA